MRNVARKAYDILALHGKSSLPQSVNWAETKAFTTIRSTGEGVSINLAGREPDGVVDPADFEKVRDQVDQVMDCLASFVDPKTGRKPVKAIYKREAIFKGKHADTAPDILMEPAELYSLTHAKTALEDADWISGDHRPEGVIVAAGPSVRPFEETTVSDTEADEMEEHLRGLGYLEEWKRAPRDTLHQERRLSVTPTPIRLPARVEPSW